MNYLTNYYKNLSEQLQEKINNLQKLLETKDEDTVEVTIHDSDRDEGEFHPTIKGTLSDGTFVDIEPGEAIPGESGEAEIHHAHEFADGDHDKNNVWAGKTLRVNRKSIIKRYKDHSS